MKSLSLTLSLILLNGCATSEHYTAQREQLAAWERVEIARSQASAKRYDALATAASGGSDIVRVAVALAAAGLGGNGQAQVTQLPQISDPSESAFRWASIILPTATAITAGYFGYKLGSTQSNNAARQTEASYGAIGTLGTQGFNSITTVAGYIQAPQPNNISTSTTTNSLTGTGVIGAGSYAIRNCNGGSAGSTTVGGLAGPANGGIC